MKIEIYLAKSGCREEGAIAGISGDEGLDMIELALSDHPQKACAAAAHKLMRLAEKFVELAREENPFNIECQERINSGRPQLGEGRPKPMKPRG